MTQRQNDIARFLRDAGWDTAQRIRIAGDASARRYDRLTNAAGETCVLMDAPPDKGEDVRPFVSIAEHLRVHGLKTPRIYHQDASLGLLLIEDFGDLLFARRMENEPDETDNLYRAAIDVLVHLRDVPVLPLESCTQDWLTKMLDPVFDWYAPQTDADARQSFKDAFRPFATDVAQGQKIIMLRDFHAENLLWLPQKTGLDRIGILDFQDAMLAHPAYDLVSVLQDARRDVSPEMEAQTLAYYLTQTSTAKDRFTTDYAILGIQRNLRIIGIFARLCLRDGKSHYVDMVPRVWGYVQRNLRHPALWSLRDPLAAILPEPTPSLLESLKSRCPEPPIQP